MFATSVVIIREGLEIALILAIVLGFVERSGRSHLRAAAWRGAAASLAACAAIGGLLFALVGTLEERTMALVEGVTMLFAAAVLTWMIVWMRANARTLRGTIEASMVGIAGAGAMFLFAGTAVLREGLETVLYLLALGSGGVTTGSMAAGIAIGAVVVFALGRALIEGGRRLDLGAWFRWTGVALVLVAGNSLGYGLHELGEVVEYSGPLAAHAWEVTGGPFADGWLRELLGMFGWAPEPEGFRLLAYALYVVPMLVWLLREPAARSGAGATSATTSSAREGELTASA